jgi:ribosomal protein S18 acetylase RimI-like enzyme
MDIEIKALSPGLLSDYLDYFDHVAFSDNPDWADCYCYFYLADPAERDWNDRTSEENREAVARLIASGEMHGYLAYVDGLVAGWCHAGPKTYFPLLVADCDAVDADVDRTGSIVCFTIDPARRRQGIAAALLAGACRGLADLGLEIAEAYPRTQAEGDAAHYHGPARLYEAAGFETYRRFPSYEVVRKRL